MINFTHVTSTKNEYPIELFHKVIEPGEVAILEGDKGIYCEGCSNHGKNGGCAWCAPDFSKLAKSYPRFHLIAVKSSFAPLNAKPKMPLYYKMVTLEQLVGSIIIGVCKHYNIMKTSKSYLIACGNCRSCRGKQGCTVAETGRCIKPLERKFSMEATGINVVETVRDQLGVELRWYEKGTNVVPEYMVRVAGFLTTMEESDCNEILAKALGERGYDVCL